MAKVKIASKLVPWRGNSWYFENPTERVYFEKENPTAEEVEAAKVFANEQYEKMGWTRCFVEPPKVIVA